MRQAIDESAAESPISELTNILEESLREPRELMEHFLKEQLSNESLHLGFNNLEIDPTEGVKFDVTLSDDKVDDVLIADRGAGTQKQLNYRIIQNTCRVKSCWSIYLCNGGT